MFSTQLIFVFKNKVVAIAASCVASNPSDHAPGKYMGFKAEEKIILDLSGSHYIDKSLSSLSTVTMKQFCEACSSGPE